MDRSSIKLTGCVKISYTGTKTTDLLLMTILLPLKTYPFRCPQGTFDYFLYETLTLLIHFVKSVPRNPSIDDKEVYFDRDRNTHVDGPFELAQSQCVLHKEAGPINRPFFNLLRTYQIMFLVLIYRLTWLKQDNLYFGVKVFYFFCCLESLLFDTIW